MKRHAKEFLVGCLVLAAGLLAVAFGWLMGVVGPLHREARYQVLYQFAGGIETGSPVRVSGVKVGKVERIDFLTPDERGETSRQGDPVTLRVTISVAEKASQSVRKDSKFYVNMAGIIGERYIEISPGSSEEPMLAAGATARGVDPPRIDQLLSQGYSVFSKIQEFIDANEKPLTELLHGTEGIIKDLNRLLKGTDRKKFLALLDNLGEITDDARVLTRRLTEPEARKVFREIVDLIGRAHSIDKPVLKKFLQDEGIRARIF